MLVETQNEAVVKVARDQERFGGLLRSPALAVAAAFAVRMALLWWIHRDRDAHQVLFFPTSHEAWNVAWSMVLGKGFSAPLSGMQGPTAWVAPSYPWLIALALKITRQDGYAATVLCLFLNSLMSALTCLPIYGIAKKIAGREVGLACSWVWVFLPTALLFPLEWLWDPSFSAFFVALLVYWTLDFPEDAPLAAWAGYGALWGISLLTNPAIGLLFPFFLFWLAQQRRRSKLPWRTQAAVAVLLLIACLAPWTARNYAAFGAWVPVKDNFGLEFWLGNNPGVKRNWSPDHHPVGDKHEMELLLSLGETRYMQLKQREAVEFIEAHPGIFLKSVFDRFLDTWTGSGDVPSDRWVSALRAGGAYIRFISVLSLLAFAGLYLVWRSLGWEVAPVWIAPIVFPIAYYLTHSTLRYRHPIDPVLTVLAVYALAQARSWVSRRMRAREASRALQVS